MRHLPGLQVNKFPVPPACYYDIVRGVRGRLD
jgi:hypothetical protein